MKSFKISYTDETGRHRTSFKSEQDVIDNWALLMDIPEDTARDIVNAMSPEGIEKLKSLVQKSLNNNISYQSVMDIINTHINPCLKHLYQIQFNDVAIIEKPTISPSEIFKGHLQVTFAYPRWFSTQTEKGVIGFDGQQERISRPSTEVAVWMKAGRGSKALGLRPGAEYLLIDDRLYQRLTWKDVQADAQKESGLRRQRNGKLIYFVKEVEMTKVISRSIYESVWKS